MRHLVMSLASCVMVFVLTAPAAAEKRPFTVHDLVAMQRLADPQVSPDGNQVAFTVTTMDLDSNSGRRDLWLAATDGSAVRRLTTHPDSDWNPRWLDDRHLVFLSTRSGDVQLHVLPLDGGEARPLGRLPLDVEAFKVGPSGKAIYVAMKVFPDCAASLACTVERLAQRAGDKASGMVFDRIFVRHWDSWKDGRRNHVFRVPLTEDGRGLGEPVDLMAGVDADCPTLPWGGDEDYAIAPDGGTMVYTAKVLDNPAEEAWSTNEDLWAVATDGGSPARCLTADNPAREGAPVFSPDGSTLAYLAMQRPGYEADRMRVMLRDWASGDTRELSEGWDRSPNGLAWSHDGTALYASAANIGNTSIFKIDATSGRVSMVVQPHTNDSPRPLPDGSLLFARDHLRSPVELFVLDAGATDPRQITHLNDALLAELKFGNVLQPPPFKGAHGDEVYYYLIYPVGYQPATTEKFPMAFLIHGGPQGSFDDHWHYRWNPQIYAAHGYATVMIDFHGSTGYGQAFTDAIRGDWGGAPYEDLMKGLDHVLFTNPWIDGERVAAAGASYGGYMINWIQGHTDRFAALVCHDGNLDETMAYFDTEELWFPEWEHGGTPWENPEGYAKHSPINFVKNWKTPELVVHGALDYRVVDTQGIATFNALQRLGVPSRLLYYPDENHWVLKPLNSIQWHEEVLGWMDRWTARE